mmetsp:Transcript_19228/g.22133  ORF Transcript_19228/g.22133 Transcript_19228/m.22133 type:complete len:80 (+) Transcript_19228:106-345(+)
MEKSNAAGITTWGKMCDLPNYMLESVDDVSKKEMIKFKEYPQITVKLSSAPTLTDHCKHYNRHMSKFGDQWKAKLKTFV